MNDPITVPADLQYWALDRLQEAGLQDTPDFLQLQEEAASQVKYERLDGSDPPTTH